MREALNVLAIATAVAGKEGALRAAQQQLVAETIKEPGCLRFELNQSVEDPRILIFNETWASENAWHNHMRGTAIRRFQASGAGQHIQDFTLFQLTLIADGSAES